MIRAIYIQSTFLTRFGSEAITFKLRDCGSVLFLDHVIYVHERIVNIGQGVPRISSWQARLISIYVKTSWTRILTYVDSPIDLMLSSSVWPRHTKSQKDSCRLVR